MKATELRIGNYVTKDDNQIYVTDFITINMAHNYKPSPLTEEWPLKFRFKRLSHSNDYLKGDFKIDLKGYFFIYIKDIGWILLCQVKYIHKLQNLYFALTGQELEMK